MKLNLGCGPDIRQGYKNLDVRDLVGVTKRDVSDRESMMQFAGADEILAYDVLEHFPRDKAREASRLWVDLLEPGGVIKIRCPEIRHAVRIAKSDEWLEQLLYGAQDYKENQHLCGFTTAMLTQLLVDLGCEIVRREFTPAGNIEIWAHK